MNKVLMIGNLTKDPETNETSTGLTVCRFTIAVKRKMSNGTDFFNVVAWRAIGENCGKYLFKGSKVAVSGELQNRNYEDGNGIKRYVTEIIAEEVQFLSRNSDNSENLQEKPTEKENLQESCTDDLPF